LGLTTYFLVIDSSGWLDLSWRGLASSPILWLYEAVRPESEVVT